MGKFVNFFVGTVATLIVLRAAEAVVNYGAERLALALAESKAARDAAPVQAAQASGPRPV